MGGGMRPETRHKALWLLVPEPFVLGVTREWNKHSYHNRTSSHTSRCERLAGRRITGRKTGISGEQLAMLASVRKARGQDSLFGQWWETWTKNNTGGGRSIPFSILPLCRSAWASATAVAHVPVPQGLSRNLQQPCIYGVVHNMWQFYMQNRVSRQRRSLFHHSELGAGSLPSRITSLL